MARLPNPLRAKLHRSYSLTEAADALGVHKNTVRNWVRDGLEVISGRPVLIRGLILRTYLQDRRAAGKCPCPPGHIYCLKCRVPRLPDPGLVEVADAAGAPMIQAICPTCTGLIFRRVSPAQLSQFGIRALSNQAALPTPKRR